MYEIHQVNQLYVEKETPVRLYEIPLSDGNIKQYAKKLKMLRVQVGDQCQEEHFRQCFRLFYATLRYMTATFLPPDPIRMGFKSVAIDCISSHLRMINQMCSYGQDFESLYEDTLLFQKETSRQIKTLHKYLRIALSSDINCLYAPAPKLSDLKRIEKDMQIDFQSLRFRSLREIRNDLMCYDCLFLAGPRNWYSDFAYLYDVSRVKQIYFIYYSWLYHDIELESLSGINEEISQPPKQDVRTIEEPQLQKDNPFVFAEHIAEDVVFSEVRAQHADSNNYGLDDCTMVSAREFYLACGFSVFLDDNGTVRILEGSGEHWDTPKIDVNRLRKGMYVLLRCADDYDYIRSTARIVYQKPYEQCMKNLIRWKRELQDKIGVEGLDSIVSRLIQYGSGIANEVNVRNWASLQTIKPKHNADFFAIMTLLEHSKEVADRLWREARKIVNWHHQAGKRVARELRDSITRLAQEKTEQWIKYGHVRVDLKTGASIDVFEVVWVSEMVVEEKYSNLNRPFGQDDVL